LSPLPLRTAEISSVGGVWIFSGTTQYSMTMVLMTQKTTKIINTIFTPKYFELY
jgi:hypothetical protein